MVAYESTVYPGATEEICVPIPEEESGLPCGKNFKIGYSPERINPGDRVHRLEKIKKIVSGMDNKTRAEIGKVYNLVIRAGTAPVFSIQTAKAIMVVEYSQIIQAVAHKTFFEMVLPGIRSLFVLNGREHVLMDVKGVLNKKEIEQNRTIRY